MAIAKTGAQASFAPQRGASVQNEKYEGGCAWWWGFHIYTTPQFFKSVFLNMITESLSHVLFLLFHVKLKSSSYTLLYIVCTIPKHVAINFNCCHIKRLNIQILKFSPEPIFQIRF
nr:MAG TPA: hypothetical protein [Caudoviricetes sp.]